MYLNYLCVLSCKTTEGKKIYTCSFFEIYNKKNFMIK